MFVHSAAAVLFQHISLVSHGETRDRSYDSATRICSYLSASNTESKAGSITLSEFLYLCASADLEICSCPGSTTIQSSSRHRTQRDRPPGLLRSISRDWYPPAEMDIFATYMVCAEGERVPQVVQEETAMDAHSEAGRCPFSSQLERYAGLISECRGSVIGGVRGCDDDGGLGIRVGIIGSRKMRSCPNAADQHLKSDKKKAFVPLLILCEFGLSLTECLPKKLFLSRPPDIENC